PAPRSRRPSRKVAMSSTARRHHRLAVPLLLLATVAATTSASAATGRPAAADTAAPHTIEVTPSTGLAAGELIDVVVRTEPGRPMGKGLVFVCRADVTYDSTADLDPAAGKCPVEGVSSSASGVVPIVPLPDKLSA